MWKGDWGVGKHRQFYNNLARNEETELRASNTYHISLGYDMNLQTLVSNKIWNANILFYLSG